MMNRVIGIMVVLISLTLVVPVSAKGPGNGQQGSSTGSLTAAEIEHVVFMREEEKLARDVYLTLSVLYPESIFGTISESEQRHMDAVKRLIDKYGIMDPVENDDIGEFTNPAFVQLYADLVAKGQAGYCEALQVGVFIEDLDIDDLEQALNDIVARDVSRVFNNLLAGSYNHLNAFNSRYASSDCE